ncbi:NAD(P)/FAD-dependent oxidoreductase [Microbacteriaceae bacterium VKM Ac-2855]|nr:NAD(P)/FAD-dependent oxidoreductase [Microbacteriaceae bacterium VKM Ac-2855]
MARTDRHRPPSGTDRERSGAAAGPREQPLAFGEAETPRADASVDVVIVGGGHNGLVAATYLAQAGRSVLVLEKNARTGGAAVSEFAFAGVDARLSRYSYLVSLLPRKIIDDLRLDIRLARRRYSSYTPDPTDPSRGLLVDTADAAATAASFAGIGAADDAALFAEFYEHTGEIARALWPTLTEPLLRRSEVKAMVREPVWQAMIERPIGEVIEAHLQNDLVRGIILTDALIGTFASAHDDDLAQNRCFLYHLIGQGTGDWDVPIGGMGSVSGALDAAARKAGARILTGTEVTSISPDGEVRYRRGPRERRVTARRVLANVAPSVLERLITGEEQPAPEGAQVKVNLMLSRLPKLLDTSVTPEAAFGGTFHVNEGYGQLQKAFTDAVRGRMPALIPCEIYCHSLTDPSILSPELAATGAHTLTIFGLHTPHRWLTPANNQGTRERLQRAVLDSLNTVLAEPIEDVILRDADGELCIETKTTQDLEESLGMPGGNIFHGALSWPFVEDDAPLDTPAERWGVATAHPRILLCGSGARRGGAVSGIGGHNAAMALLEEL